MGRDFAEAFPAAREVFQEVDDALSQKLSAIMWDGPKETLTLTENAQPALMAVSMAVMRVLETENGDTPVVAGDAATDAPTDPPADPAEDPPIDEQPE